MDNKSNMEIALEFIDEHPSLTNELKEDNFAIFWEKPKEVIALFNMTLYTLSNMHQLPQSTVDDMKPDLMNDACHSYLNLNTDEAE